MNKVSLTKDSQFTVGEEKWLNYILGFLFLALFLYGLTDAILKNFKNIDYQSYVFALAVGPAIYCFRRAYSKRIYIRINKKGIYQDEKLVTDWASLLKASLAQDSNKKVYDIRDKFVLILEFKRRDDPKQGIRKKIPLTNTQNKSEEDVLEAVQFFWYAYKRTTGNPA